MPLSSLDDAALGSGRRIEPCLAENQPHPAKPARPLKGPTIGLTFSGGGFRATLAALGMIRYLADADLLKNVRYASSVSGGSVTNGLLAKHWPALCADNFTAAVVDNLLVNPTVSDISRRSVKWALIRNLWRAIGRRNRTDVLAWLFDQRFFGGLELEQLDPEVRWVINAANVVSGVRFGFERDVVGDYVSGVVATHGTGLTLAQAVAASAAVPGTFAAWPLPRSVQLPCAGPITPTLLDGGVYDNTGLEVLDGDAYRHVFTITMNAGGLLRPGRYGKIPLVRDLARANALLYRQSTGLRTRAMVDAFVRGKGIPVGSTLPAGARHGLLVALATDQPKRQTDALECWIATHPERRTYASADLSLVPTVFDRLDETLCRALVYRGWWLVGAAMAEYFPQFAPDPTTLSQP